jgi:long-chain acyl-CoA synthetase
MGSAYEERPWLALYDEGAPADLVQHCHDTLALFRAACTRNPHGTAVAYFDGGLSYTELDELSDGLAVHLRERGFAHGDRIALYLQNVPQFAVAALAGWKAGGVVVPLNPMYRSRELTTILSDSGARAVVALEGAWHDTMAAVAEAVGVPIAVTTSELDLQTRDDPRVFARTTRRPAPGVPDLLEVARRHRGTRPPAVSYTATDIALLTYTSGTSGAPKGATNTHGGITFNAQSFAERLRVPPGACLFALAPLFHITGTVLQFAGAMQVAGTLATTYRFEPGVVLDALVEHRPYYMVGPATAYVALMNHPQVGREHFASLRRVSSGGAPLPPAVVAGFRKRFGHYIRNGYGLTETTSTATSVPSSREAPVHAASGTLSIGVPSPNTVLRIVDEAGTEVPVGEVGEIVVEGPMVVPEYWNKPAETAASIPGGRLRTGDVGFMDAEGWFYVVDRKKDMIIASGFKVWPREVEDVLYGHPAVREAAVVGVPDPYRGETVKAFVSLRPGRQVTAEELVAHCRQQMATYKYPRAVEFPDELPKTASGKVLRRQLRGAP